MTALAGRHAVERGHDAVPVGRDDDGAAGEPGLGRQAARQIGHRHVRVVPHEVREPAGLRAQRLVRARGDHQREVGGRARRWSDVRRLLQDHVGVRAADPERRHPRPTRPGHLRPRDLLTEQLHRAGGPVDM